MPISIDKIYSGEILLKEVCDYFNDEKGYERVSDIFNISSETKEELLYFINKKCKNDIDGCNFGIRALNRLIEQIQNQELVGLVPKNPTLCTLCFLPLKRKEPSLKFKSQKNSKGIVHGVEVYVEKFNKEFIEPLIISEPITPVLPEIFSNTCWYLFKNVKDFESAKRKIERNILKFVKEGSNIKAEYYSTNISTPDWIGDVKYHSIKKQLLLYLIAPKNKLRTMRMKFENPYFSAFNSVEGSMTFTKMKELDKLVKITVFLRKVDCDKPMSLNVLNEGEDKSILEIDEKLKKAKCKIITIVTSHPCHDKE